MKYPPERSFVVQFSSDTDPSLERMIGRVEHLESGRRCRFDSAEEFVEFMKRVLTAPPVASQTTTHADGSSKGGYENEDV